MTSIKGMGAAAGAKPSKASSASPEDLKTAKEGFDKAMKKAASNSPEAKKMIAKGGGGWIWCHKSSADY